MHNAYRRIVTLDDEAKHLAAIGHAPGWLISVFEKMGEDPDAPDYLKPTDDDVWAFIRQIKNWLVDPNRKGIPA